MHPLILVGIFIVSSVLGYVLIKNVPSLLHTPLMSGMNALSGVTVLGAMIAVATAASTGSKVLALVAIAPSTTFSVSSWPGWCCWASP